MARKSRPCRCDHHAFRPYGFVAHRFHPFAEAMKDPFWRLPWLALIMCFWALATYPIEWSWKILAARRHDGHESKKRIAYLKNLTKKEKKALQAYISQGTKTARWNVDSGVIAGLVGNSVLYRASKYGNAVGGFAFNISDWAWAYLLDHPEYIETPGDDSKPDAFT